MSPVDRQGGEARNHEAVREKVARAIYPRFDRYAGGKRRDCLEAADAAIEVINAERDDELEDQREMGDVMARALFDMLMRPDDNRSRVYAEAAREAWLDEARSSGSAAQPDVWECSGDPSGETHLSSGSAAQNHEEVNDLLRIRAALLEWDAERARKFILDLTSRRLWHRSPQVEDHEAIEALADEFRKVWPWATVPDDDAWRALAKLALSRVSVPERDT